MPRADAEFRCAQITKDLSGAWSRTNLNDRVNLFAHHEMCLVLRVDTRKLCDTQTRF
jgi:hypothetical protein